jgi:predicted nucleic acid-binding protein
MPSGPRLSERLPRAVIDSDVIFSRVLHELFGRVAAEARLLDLIWSEPLLAEAERVLIERKPMPPGVAARWVGYLRQAFPGGEVDISRLDPAIELATLTSDSDDQHVCAVAIVGGADYLFSFDRGYLRKELAAHGVNVLSPDVFLSAQVDNEPEALRTVIAEQAAVWGGGKAIGELLDAYERAKVPVFAGKAQALFEE